MGFGWKNAFETGHGAHTTADMALKADPEYLRI